MPRTLTTDEAENIASTGPTPVGIHSTLPQVLQPVPGSTDGLEPGRDQVTELQTSALHAGNHHLPMLQPDSAPAPTDRAIERDSEFDKGMEIATHIDEFFSNLFDRAAKSSANTAPGPVPQKMTRAMAQDNVRKAKDGLSSAQDDLRKAHAAVEAAKQTVKDAECEAMFQRLEEIYDQISSVDWAGLAQNGMYCLLPATAAYLTAANGMALQSAESSGAQEPESGQGFQPAKMPAQPEPKDGRQLERHTGTPSSGHDETIAATRLADAESMELPVKPNDSVDTVDCNDWNLVDPMASTNWDAGPPSAAAVLSTNSYVFTDKAMACSGMHFPYPGFYPEPPPLPMPEPVAPTASVYTLDSHDIDACHAIDVMGSAVAHEANY